MSMTHDNAVLNPELLQTLTDLYALVHQAAHDGAPAHQVELAIWQHVLRLGRQALQHFFHLHGSGDQGETLTRPDGHVLKRLPEPHRRRYVSILGEFVLRRTAYGSREGQKIELLPLDQHLQLPDNAFSYLLQDWDQALCAEQATPFRLNRPLPPAAEEGELFVLSADGKGVVMRRDPEDPAPPAYRTKGDKASQKRMATVGTAYSVDRYVRTPEQVVAALFRDGPRPEAGRPAPQHKQVWASLAQTDVPVSGMEAVFVWLLWELCRRNPGNVKEVVYLSDGQESLWDAQEQYLGGRCIVGILDLLHVTPRLWQAAHVFYAEKSAAAEAFVRERLLRVLRGQVVGVVQGLRVMGGRRGLTASKRKALRALCNYLEKNRERMCYGEYLACGYPIASGVIEGACRHLVKDRMERAGMHWTVAGAQAMLEVRSVYVSGEWEAYQSYRIERETQRLYPNRELMEPQYAMAV